LGGGIRLGLEENKIMATWLGIYPRISFQYKNPPNFWRIFIGRVFFLLLASDIYEKRRGDTDR